MKSFLLIATLLALAFVPMRADASSFTFSFGNGVETVTGEMNGIPLPSGSFCLTFASCNWEATSITFTSMSPAIAFAYGQAGGLDLSNQQFNPHNEWTEIGGTLVNGHLKASLECTLDCIILTLSYPGYGSLFAAHATFAGGIIVQDQVEGPLTIEPLTIPAAVPEPASLILLGTGAVGLFARRRRKPFKYAVPVRPGGQGEGSGRADR